MKLTDMRFSFGFELIVVSVTICYATVTVIMHYMVVL